MFAVGSNSLDIKALESWIGWRLNPDHLGVLFETSFEIVEISHIDHIPCNTGLRAEVSSQVSLGSTVDIIDSQEMIIFGEETEACCNS